MSLCRYAVTLIGDTVSERSVEQVAAVLAAAGVTIDGTTHLGGRGISAVELQCGSGKPIDAVGLRQALQGIADLQGLDIALQTDGPHRRARRLVVFDMDSTLIQAETIDEFARELGRYDEVAEITEKAMRGELD